MPAGEKQKWEVEFFSVFFTTFFFHFALSSIACEKKKKNSSPSFLSLSPCACPILTFSRSSVASVRLLRTQKHSKRRAKRVCERESPRKKRKPMLLSLCRHRKKKKRKKPVEDLALTRCRLLFSFCSSRWRREGIAIYACAARECEGRGGEPF